MHLISIVRLFLKHNPLIFDLPVYKMTILEFSKSYDIRFCRYSAQLLVIIKCYGKILSCSFWVQNNLIWVKCMVMLQFLLLTCNWPNQSYSNRMTYSILWSNFSHRGIDWPKHCLFNQGIRWRLTKLKSEQFNNLVKHKSCLRIPSNTFSRYFTHPHNFLTLDWTCVLLSDKSCCIGMKPIL